MQKIDKLMGKQFWLWLVLIVPSLSLVESPVCTKLTPNQKTASVQFKYLNGSNRIAEAKQLLNIIDNGHLKIENETNSQIQHSTFNIQHYTFSDLKKIFGTPTSENLDGSLTYIYDYTNNKSFTIKYNKQTQITEITTNN